MLEFKQVEYSYKSTDDMLLSHINFTLVPGEFVSLLGKNGSGKSTIAKLANGLRLPLSGEVLLDGKKTLEPQHLFHIRSRIQLLGQDPASQIVSSTVFEELCFGPCNLGLDETEVKKRVAQVLELTELNGLEKRSPESLSGGEQQRLMLASVLVMKPEYLILDESFSMLDPVLAKKLMSIIVKINKSGVAILNISHNPQDLIYSDSALLLKEGTLSKTFKRDEFRELLELLDAEGLITPGSYTKLLMDLKLTPQDEIFMNPESLAKKIMKA